MRFPVDRTLMNSVLVFCAVLISLVGIAYCAQSPAAAPIPAISADLGSCSVQFTVQDGSGKPVSGATMRVRIAYGFMSVRKLDLETSTNSEGKVRFEGLPNNLKRALFFHASKDNLEGTAFYDAAKNCAAQHTIVMVPKKKESEANEGAEEQKDQQ